MKKSRIAIIILTIILCLSLLSSCVTTAKWIDQPSDTNEKDVNTVPANGSEKYIVYAALDSSHNLIASDDTTTETAEYAVVGYTGRVAELVIPAQYDNKNVTRVILATPYENYKCYMNGASYTDDDARLTNKPEVTSIVFGSNVAFVGAGVCAGMINLTKVTFTAASAVTLGDAAFSYCVGLRQVTGLWTPDTDATPFFASGYTPAP